MIGCRVQQTCRGRAEEAVEAGRNGKGGTSTGGGNPEPMGGQPSGSGRAISISMEGIFGKPQERSSNL
jgi:hypothetical protein